MTVLSARHLIFIFSRQNVFGSFQFKISIYSVYLYIVCSMFILSTYLPIYFTRHFLVFDGYLVGEELVIFLFIRAVTFCLSFLVLYFLSHQVTGVGF